MKRLRIAYVGSAPKDAREVERRRALLQSWASPGTTIEMVYATQGPASIESMYEEYLAIPGNAANMQKLDREGFDGAIVGCAGDPGLDAYREICSQMVVVGPALASFHAAALLGHHFSLLTVAGSMIPSCHELVNKYGLSRKLASVRAIEIPILEFANNRSETFNRLLQLGRQAMEQDHADVLVLGCMSMAFLQVAEEMQEVLGIPIINPAKTAVKTIETLLNI